MKARFVILIAMASVAIGVGLGVAMQPKFGDKPRPQIAHRVIDTQTLSHFLECYCHDFSIQKDAIAAYTTCELQVVPSDQRVQTIWRDNKLMLDDDGSYRVVVMMKPSDHSKTFNASPDLDIYFNGMTRPIGNPFLGLLKEKGVAILRKSKLTDGTLILFEWDGKTDDDPKVTIRLVFK